MRQNNYNLMECSVMGIADYLRSTKLKVPQWMNQIEVKAYRIGFERAKKQCER